MDPSSDRPLIDYPCEWEYRVIGIDPDEIRAAIHEVVGDMDHQLREANRSGKYLSMSLTLMVEDEAHRDALFQALNAKPKVRMVI
jgi:putative lipoic acid-binding regulatory protein